MFYGKTLVFLIYVLISSCYAQEFNCTTPDGGVGVCKHINKCKHLMDLLTPQRKNDENIAYVRERVCGNQDDMMVCCNDCFTPDGKAGLCTEPENCPHILNLLETSQRIDYVQNSICVNGANQVCCGPPPSPAVRGHCKDRVNAFPPDLASECCGIDSSLEGKISGGKDTRIDQYPWLVLLEYKDGNELSLKCGGTLISGKYVVTAAHCVKGRLTSGLVSVRLGEFDTDNDGQDCVELDCTDPAVSIPIEEIIPHPEYNATSVWNDIALLRLKDMANHTDFIRPICLPWSDVTVEVPVSTLSAYAAGWGKVTNYITSSRLKQHVELPLVDTRLCHRIHSQRSLLKAPLWSKQLCAGGERGKDSCKGDSGGPLMLERPLPSSKKPAHQLIGVVSFGPDKCGTEFLPGIYTKVYEYKNWIRSHIRP